MIKIRRFYNSQSTQILKSKSSSKNTSNSIKLNNNQENIKNSKKSFINPLKTLYHLIPEKSKKFLDRPKLSDLSPSTNYISPHTHLQPTIERLLVSGVHLGHNKKDWHPNMLPYIYGVRAGIHIINLDHTLAHLRKAIHLTREIALHRGNIVFLGSRPWMEKTMIDAATKGKAFYVTNWKPGTITNREHVLRKSSGYHPDKVIQSITHPIMNYTDQDHSSIKKYHKSPIKPDLLIIFDMPNNKIAIKEANLENIPVIALCDTDCDPNLVPYPIPANDDNLPSIELIAGLLSLASREGHELCYTNPKKKYDPLESQNQNSSKSNLESISELNSIEESL